jgi:hypothetical protein
VWCSTHTVGPQDKISQPQGSDVPDVVNFYDDEIGGKAGTLFEAWWDRPYKQLKRQEWMEVIPRGVREHSQVQISRT